MRMLSVWNTRLEDLFIMLLLLGFSDVIVYILNVLVCMLGICVEVQALHAVCVCAAGISNWAVLTNWEALQVCNCLL